MVREIQNMVTSCCGYGCSQRFVKGSSITFHCFPKDSVRYKQWLIAVRREGFTPKSHSRICSKHFTEDSFNRNKFGGSWLKDDAVPTLFDFTSRPKKGITLGRLLQESPAVVKISPSPPPHLLRIVSSDDLEDVTSALNFKHVEDFTVHPSENEEMPIYRLSRLSSDSEDVVIPDCDMDIEDAQIVQPLKKKKRHFYRYSSDFKDSTISSSNIDKRFLEKAMKEIERQRQVIRTSDASEKSTID